MWVIVYPSDSRYRRPSLHHNLDIQTQSATNEPRDRWQPAPLDQPYTAQRAQYLLYQQQWAQDVQQQPTGAVAEGRDTPPRQVAQPYAGRAALYLFDRTHHVPEQNQEDPLSWAPTPLHQSYTPWQAQRLLYQPWAEDVQTQSATNEPRDGWTPRPLVVPQPPRAALLNLYAWGEDAASSAAVAQPDTVAAWSPTPLKTPRPPVPVGLYLWSWALDVQTQDATNEPRDTPPRRLQQPYGARPPFYLFLQNPALDVQTQSATNEPRDGWTPKPLTVWVPPRPLYLFDRLTQVPEQNQEDPQSWTAPRLQRPYNARPQPYVQQPALDVQDQGGGNEPRDGWAPRPLRVGIPPRLASLLYYYSGTAQDFDAPTPGVETPLSWVPRPLAGSKPPRPIGLYTWNEALDVQDQGGGEVGRDTSPKRLPAQYHPQPWLYQQNQDVTSSNVEGLLAWTPRPVRPFEAAPRLYLWGADAASSNDETPQSWVPAPLRLHPVTPAAFLYLYRFTTTQDTSVAAEGSPRWGPQRLLQPRSPLWWLYEWNKAQDVQDQGGGETPLAGWRPSPLPTRWTVARSLYYHAASVTAGAPPAPTVLRRRVPSYLRRLELHGVRWTS